MNGAPTHFTIRPDDHHVPYAGTAGDGRKFFLTEELFSGTAAWVALFLWNADGSFDDVRLSAAGSIGEPAPGTSSASRQRGRTH